MKVTLLPSCLSTDERERYQFLTTYLVNDRVALDAGGLGFFGTPEDQARVRHVFLSHSHIDHIASLPVFLENAYDSGTDCVTIHATRPVLDCLRRDIFNDHVWPDFVHLSPEQPFLRLALLEPGRAVEAEGLRITPVALHHVVPTVGFIVEEPGACVAVISDTGPTDAIWQYANAAPHLKAVFLEATFPDAMAALATTSGHLTPRLFAAEAAKLQRPISLYAIHIKARYHDAVVRELTALGLPNLHIAAIGTPYQF